MKSGFVFFNPFSFMKRFLLPSLLLLAMGGTAFCADALYLNTGVVQVPPMDPQLVQIDATTFVNNSKFDVDMTGIQNLTSASSLFTTSDTLNYTNNGLMIGIPGFDFENFPASVGQAQPSANFVNNGNGLNGGVIAVTNIYSGGNLFGFGGIFFNLFGALNFDTPGLALFKVRADNVVNSGLITMDNTGVIDLRGKDLDLRRGRLVMTPGSSLFNNSFNIFNTSFGINSLDYGLGTFGTNSFGWFPFADLTPTTALSPIFASSVNFFFEEMQLTNATVYFQDLNPQPDASGTIVWRGIYLQDNSPSNVTKNVYFNASGLAAGAFNIEWTGTFRDPLTGQLDTNYFYLSDEPVLRRNTNTFFVAFPGVPSDFSFAESTTKLINAPAATPGYANPAPDSVVTNDFSYVSIRPNAVLVDTNVVVGGNPTNLPGRIQLTASHSLNLANARIVGANYLSLNSPNQFLGNSNAYIAAPYADLNIGVTNGSLTMSNLLVPELPAWTGVPGAPSAVFQFGFTSLVPVEMGGIQAWSGSYIFVDANGFTNDVRMLLVNSALKPTTPAFQQDVILHDPGNLVIDDELNIFRTFSSDATTLTVNTNANSAFSLAGQVNLLSSDIFWSASLPDLQYLTNYGTITTKNLANFAGNMLTPNSDPAAATPYQAFVNGGTIVNQGTFVRANFFLDSGTIQEDVFGGIDIGGAPTTIITNGALLAPNGSVSIAGGSLFISNSIIEAGQSLTLTPSCSLSDGYVFGNQFGEITNATLPNVVTNGNTFVAGSGVRIMAAPESGTADLLGTTITNFALNGQDSINIWPAQDHGASPLGFADNLALGRMVLNSDAVPSQFTFAGLSGNNAIYVDTLIFQGAVTNTDANGNFPSVSIAPGMKIYYAQALMNGVSIAEKLNGKNGGGFEWVSNYAGVYSSTNMAYPDGNTYIFNEALAVSPDIDSDGDGTVNQQDPTPIPAGLTFPITVTGPQPCASGNGSGTGNGGIGGNGDGSAGSQSAPGTLTFPQHSSGTSSISFPLAQGAYNGLFYETNGVTPATSGFFTAAVTGKGAFTAKVQLGGQTYTFSGAFDASGNLSGPIISKNSSLTVSLQLVNNDQITGEISGTGWSAQLLAQKAAYGPRNPVPPAWVGKDSVLLAMDATNSTSPAGDSFGTVTVSKTGTVQWTATLPDGSKVSQKSALSKDGLWPLYSAPYSGAGSFIGWMQMTNSDPDLSGSAVWILPPGKSQAYKDGVTNNVKASGSSVTGLIGSFSRSTVVLSGENLSPGVTNNVIVMGKTGLSGNNTLKLSVDLKNGLFSGSVEDPTSSQTLSFQGALLEKSGIGGGFFLNANKDQGGKVYLAPAK